MCRIAYFGTDGCLGHHFKAISGKFSPQEKEDLSKYLQIPNFEKY